MDPSSHHHHRVQIPQLQPHYPPSLPPGFRFHPTDEELVTHYLTKKAAADPLPLHIITDIDLYKFDPWELPGMACFGENEWYFFSLRDRKYPNGARPNRASASGYWKATGTDKPITGRGGTRKVGVKKALVFYKGKPPKGIKTHWIMHEYRLTTDLGSSSRPSVPSFSSTRKSLRLDDWVLCRIYKKNRSAAGKDDESSLPKLGESKEEESSSCIDQACVSLPQDQRLGAFPKMNSFDSFLDGDPFLENFLLDPEPSNYGVMHPQNHHQLININGVKFLGQQDIMVPQGIVPKAELAESKDTVRSFMDHWPTNLNQKYTQPPLWQGEVKAMSRANT